jgi:hypothetical protein
VPSTTVQTEGSFVFTILPVVMPPRTGENGTFRVCFRVVFPGSFFCAKARCELTTRLSAWSLLGLIQVDVTISAPEIRNLVAAPINLIGAPGANKANFILYIAARSAFLSIPFTNPAGSSTSIVYDGPSRIQATTNLTSIDRQIVQPQSTAGNVISLGTGAVGNLTDAELISEIANKNILIVNNLTTPQNFDGGGDGAVVISAVYVTISV